MKHIRLAALVILMTAATGVAEAQTGTITITKKAVEKPSCRATDSLVPTDRGNVHRNPDKGRKLQVDRD